MAHRNPGPDAHLPNVKVLGVLLGALALCYPVLSNGFPFMYPDTCTYLDAGFSGRVSDIRPATYGFLLRHLSLRESLWPVVFAQALMISWCVHALCRALAPGAHPLLPAGILLLLTLFTRVGTVVGMMMPDAFTPVLLICTTLLMTVDRLPRVTLWSCLVLTTLSCAMHHSHTPIMTTLLLSGVVARKVMPAALPRLLRWRAVLIAMAIGHLAIPTIHMAMDGGFRWSSASSIFLVNRLHQHGLLVPFLRRACANEDHILCDQKDDLPGDLLWDDRSPLNTGGTWSQHEPAFRTLATSALLDPATTGQFLLRTIEVTVVQFFMFEGELLVPVEGWSWSFDSLRQHLPKTITACTKGRQYRGQWDRSMEDVLQRFSVMSALAFCVFLIGRTSQHGGDAWVGAALLIILGLMANALICSGVSMADVRFQNRVAWMIPLLACIHLMRSAR